MSPNYNFLQRYLKLQYSIMFDELITLDFATIGYSQTESSVFWNCALPNKLLNLEQLEKIEEILNSVKRRSTLYIENCNELDQLTGLLKMHGYNKSFEDSWQFWNNGEIDQTHFELIKKVASQEELETSISTLDACYRNNDPQNPYGELGSYLKTTENAWYKHHKTGRTEYFVAYKESQPVGVSALTNFNGIGYISNVGSLQTVRGQGFGKAITLYCVKESIKNGNQSHCLATEEGFYPNEFYKRIGFTARFSAVGYTKS